MTAEERRIAILEYLGWTDLTRAGRRGEDGPSQALRGVPPGGDPKHPMIAPNHPVSLKLIHGLERDHLTSSEAGNYDSWLWIVLKRDWEQAGNNLAHLASWHATAFQKTEAFLKTKGLWKRQNANEQTELPPEPL